MTDAPRLLRPSVLVSAGIGILLLLASALAGWPAIMGWIGGLCIGYAIGAALGAPAVGLYGLTDPARVGPGRRYLDLVVDAFHDPGESWHPPRAGYREGRMERIGVERVLEAVELARSRYSRAGGAPRTSGTSSAGSDSSA